MEAINPVGKLVMESAFTALEVTMTNGYWREVWNSKTPDAGVHLFGNCSEHVDWSEISMGIGVKYPEMEESILLLDSNQVLEISFNSALKDVSQFVISQKLKKVDTCRRLNRSSS